MPDPLVVRLSGTEIGRLLPDGSFQWVRGWERVAPLNAPVLSKSLPFGADGLDPAPFFGGLLPEGAGLEQLAREARVSSNDLYGLLAEVGADVGGSVTVGEPRPPLDPVAIEEREFERILARARGYLRKTVVGGGGSSATGVQQKLALTLDESRGEWLIGRGSTPSTHLLKPVLREHSARIRAEAALNEIARSLELSAHDAHVEDAGAHEVLVIERYDRVRDENGATQRVHQEDAAQALGLPWGGNDKYENVNPRANLKNVAALLKGSGSVFEPTSPDRERLLALVALNVVAGNTDAHAKNFSIMLPRLATAERRAVLADAYDIVPQSYFSAEPEPLAMRICGQSLARAVTSADIVSEGTSWGIARARAEQVVGRTLQGIVASVEREGIRHGAPGTLADFLVEQASNLLRGDPAWTRSSPPALAFAR